MSDHSIESLSPQFVAAIEQNQHAAHVLADTIELTAGKASVQIRRRGAFLTRLTLEDRTQRPVSLLYSGDDLTRPKLAASHAMLPVGPYQGVGGQHGFPRWADYDIEALRNDWPDSGHVRLEATTYDYPGRLRRTISLTPDQLLMTTSFQNNTRAPMATSLGEHLYFALDEGTSIHDIQINNEPIDSLLHPGATEQIQQGNAQFWPGYGGSAFVSMPNRAAIDLGTIADSEGVAPGAQMGMLLWQRPGEPYICLEPTLGLMEQDGLLVNDGLSVPAYGGRLAMSTSIALS